MANRVWRLETARYVRVDGIERVALAIDRIGGALPLSSRVPRALILTRRTSCGRATRVPPPRTLHAG